MLLFKRNIPFFLSLPFALVIFAFFVVPLCLVIMVSFWDYNAYSIIPDFIFTNYEDVFYGCVKSLPDLCTSFATYLSSLKFVFIVWLITLVIGFMVALFLSFCVNSLQMQVVLFLLCTIPFWTSNVIRMISWIPLLGRNGLVNSTLQDAGIIDAPLEWLLYSQFSVTLAFVHLYTLFMVVPIFNSMMRIDRSLLEAAHDAGASTWQTLTNIIIPLCRPGHHHWIYFCNHYCHGRLFDHWCDGGAANPFCRKNHQCGDDLFAIPSSSSECGDSHHYYFNDYFCDDKTRRYSERALNDFSQFSHFSLPDFYSLHHIFIWAYFFYFGFIFSRARGWLDFPNARFFNLLV